MEKLRLLIAGGDMRQVFCAEALAEKFDIFTIGIGDEAFPEFRKSRNAEECGAPFDAVVLPVPPLNEKGCITAPCCENELCCASVRRMIKADAPVFIGREDDRLPLLFGDHPMINYMEREEVSLKNAIPTAEGAVKLALDELPVTLNGLSVLIVGMGRIGTSLAAILKGFGADVTAAVHNAKGAAKARIMGVKPVCTRDIDGGFSLVFNTVPKLIFDRDVLKKFSRGTLFIDLASKPGGFDFPAAAELGMKVLWALGLPGKTAPVTAGEIVAETVAEILGDMAEGGGKNG